MTLQEQTIAEAEAEAAKQRGNVLFSEGQYAKALDAYLDAVKHNPGSAVYFSNAAACYSRLGNHSLAVEMANEALSRDPANVKAYYRRGVGRMHLGEYRMALADLKLVCRSSDDPQAKKQLAECDRLLAREAFAKAIHVARFELCEESIDRLDVDATYEGPLFEGAITLDFVLAMIEWFRAEKRLPAKYACRVLLLARQAFKGEPSLVSIQKHNLLTICGDTHGQFFDLLEVFALNGNPGPDHAYLFNGDFVDRGPMSVEVFLTLCAWKALWPRHFFMSRGNHESEGVNKFHGFYEEVGRKYRSRHDEMYQVMNEVMNFLPLAYNVYGKYFVVHGGLPRADLTLDEVCSIKRVCIPPNGSLMSHLLWSDPRPEPGIGPSHRGEGVLFGPDVTESFLARNNLAAIIRSHVWEPTGWKSEHNDKCITIFSAPNYIPGTPSPAAYINVASDGSLTFKQFYSSTAKLAGQ